LGPTLPKRFPAAKTRIVPFINEGHPRVRIRLGVGYKDGQR